MKPGETPIEMARRHVAEGETHVGKQHRILTRLSEDGLPTDMAAQLLAEFEQTLRDHQASLARMEEEQRSGRRDEGGNLLDHEDDGEPRS